MVVPKSPPSCLFAFKVAPAMLAYSLPDVIIKIVVLAGTKTPIPILITAKQTMINHNGTGWIQKLIKKSANAPTNVSQSEPNVNLFDDYLPETLV